jgi:hypothetical protein
MILTHPNAPRKDEEQHRQKVNRKQKRRKRTKNQRLEGGSTAAFKMTTGIGEKSLTNLKEGTSIIIP